MLTLVVTDVSVPELWGLRLWPSVCSAGCPSLCPRICRGDSTFLGGIHHQKGLRICRWDTRCHTRIKRIQGLEKDLALIQGLMSLNQGTKEGHGFPMDTPISTHPHQKSLLPCTIRSIPSPPNGKETKDSKSH